MVTSISEPVTRQAGFSELQMAALTDVHLIEKARRHAQEFMQQDPELEKPEHQLLRQTLASFWGEGRTSFDGKRHEGDIS